MNVTNTTVANSKQKQLANSSDLMRSLKASTSLAEGLTKERIHIQHEFQKISHGKDQLEELKKMKKVKEPTLTAEEKATILNKAEIKSKGFNMTMVSSEKGKNMIEKQKDSRRQRHIEALQECEKFVEQFYDNFKERQNEIKARIKVFISGSDSEVQGIMSCLTDELLLSNEISYVNGIWEKVCQHRQARKDEVQQLRQNIDDLKQFQQKGSGGYLDSMRRNLVDIAFILEPAVDQLIAQWINTEQNKYLEEHVQNETFYGEVVNSELEKFDALYNSWKESVVKFHLLKQDDAIKRFLDRINSQEFVNPVTRIQIFANLKTEQINLFQTRMELMSQIENIQIPFLNKEFVTTIDEKLKQCNEEAQIVFDKIVEDLAKDMENTNEDLDIVLYDLKDFLQKNDAQLEEGTTFDIILDKRVKPTVDRRKEESKTLITNAVKYMEEFDYKMNETCQNIVNFFLDLANKFDTNKEKLKQTDINYQVALAQCGDLHDEIASAQEDELKEKIEDMKKAIHHIMLNEKLEDCFLVLDQITKTYRNYNTEYIKIVEHHPETIDNFYNNFEKECLQVFKIQDESQRDLIQTLFVQETEVKQKKLEEIAIKKYEEEKKAEELKKAEEEKNKPTQTAGKSKAPPPAAKKGGKGEPEKPLVDVPKLEVPKIMEFSTEMGNRYLIERSLEEITIKLLDTNSGENSEEAKKEDSKSQEASVTNLNNIVNPPSKLSQIDNKQSVLNATISSQTIGKQVPNQNNIISSTNNPQILESNKEENTIVVQEEIKFLQNDYLEKANMLPPEDPYGEQCLHKDLLITNQGIQKILQETLNKALQYLLSEKLNYQKKVAREGKDLIDKSVDELDENLRKQWPRKGRLEVEIYQERKSQITAHNKKYERQVRTCLEKYNLIEEQWLYLLETIDSEFQLHLVSQDKLRQQLPEGKNLASLQGVSRREKDSSQTFEEKCHSFEDKMFELSETQPNMLIHQNDDMLNGCVLFEKQGNYSKEEIEWYREQMREINEMIIKCKEERTEKRKELQQKMEKLIKEPIEKFDKDYKGSILNLSAKEGLGKTYGQPRRIAQERLRGEMTKCESAQKGIDVLILKLKTLIEKGKAAAGFNQNSSSYTQNQHDYSKDKQSLTIEIRITLISIIRCIIFYGQHLGGFLKEPKTLPRLSYLEQQADVDLQSSEIVIDGKRMEEELENLGPIGFKNNTQQQLKFPDVLVLIEKQSKELCQKLYTGENAKFLVGPEKIPEYLSNFIENMKRQSEDFRISSIRELRQCASNLVDLCKVLPLAIFTYLSQKFTFVITKQLEKEELDFKMKKNIDDATKKKHQQLFRPNLENPSNKQLTLELNNQENERSEAFKEYIDEKQLQMLDIEQDNSLEFYNAYLNNMRSLLKIYDCLPHKEDFIVLPGDEVIEKKHQNIKMLTAQAQKQDLTKKSTRKWQGLGPNVFDIDYASLFDQYKEFKKEEADPIAPIVGQSTNGPANAKGGANNADASAMSNLNELINDIEIPNTEHHKAIVKARNEAYGKFKNRFEQSVRNIVESLDEERKEELRFNAYWAQNLKEITQKHI